MTERRVPPGTVEIERRRVRRVTSLRPYLALLLIVIGLAVFLIELGRYWLADRAISGVVISIGALMAFVGFFMLDSADALVGARFVVDSFTQIVGTVRSGRRSTDRPVVVAETAVTADVELPPPDKQS